MLPGGTDWYIAGNRQLKRQFRQPGFYHGQQSQLHTHPGQLYHNVPPQPLPTGPRFHHHSLPQTQTGNQQLTPQLYLQFKEILDKYELLQIIQ